MITSAGNSVDMSIAHDGRGGWLGVFLLFFFRWTTTSPKLEDLSWRNVGWLGLL